MTSATLRRCVYCVTSDTSLRHYGNLNLGLSYAFDFVSSENKTNCGVRDTWQFGGKEMERFQRKAFHYVEKV